MHINNFDYTLPNELIARYPQAERTASRLLVLGQDEDIHHKHFYDLPNYLKAGDLLVMNNSKVMLARLYGKKNTGGQVEILVERVLSPTEVLAHVKASKALKPGVEIRLAGSEYCLVTRGRKDALFHLELTNGKDIFDVMNEVGHMPLPPYMEREDELSDKERYQTVYAKQEGSVAAPTAGLHFTDTLFDELKSKGVQTAELTLHVGAGTFQPVRVDDIHSHHMHQEWIDVPQGVVDAIKQTKASGGRVIAVGTTTVRSLETAALSGELVSYRGETDIFIYPGFDFKVIDGMITNFHLPKSTLLMLVSAFSGREAMLYAYHEAIAEKYRFFSYGDAMLLL